MRDLTRVIDFLCKEVIPAEEVALKDELKAITRRAIYVPPESHAGLWRLTGETLFRHAGLPEGEPWKIRLGNVFNDKEQVPEDWRP